MPEGEARVPWLRVVRGLSSAAASGGARVLRAATWGAQADEGRRNARSAGSGSEVGGGMDLTSGKGFTPSV